MELHLSDAFIQSDHEHGKPCLECTARVYNIIITDITKI